MKYVTALSLALMSAACFGNPRPDPPPVVEMARQVSVAQVGAVRLDYHQPTARLVFDKYGADTYADIWTSLKDGSQTLCLTCDHPQLKALGYTKHVGNPTWTHSGRFVLFQAQDASDLGCTDAAAAPGIGGCNDLVVMGLDTGAVTRLRSTATGVGAMLHIAVNAADTKVFIAERVSLAPIQWILQVCDLFLQGEPRVSSCRPHQPSVGRAFLEAHQCMNSDCTLLLFSCMCDASDVSLFDTDIATYDTIRQRLVKLTNTDSIWDEHAHQGEDGRILWMSSAGLPATYPLRTEWWIMNADGSNQRQLTAFNDKASTQYRGYNLTAADSAWVSRTTFFGSLRLASTQVGELAVYQIGPR